MKTFKEFMDEAIRQYRDSWYGTGKKSSRGNTSTVDDDHMTVEPEKMELDGKTIAWKQTPKPKPHVVQHAEDLIPQSDDVIHRGMSHDEYHNILKTGKISSRGIGNIGNEQKGLTYFTTRPESAASYSNSFAMAKNKPTHQKPAYIVSIKRPHPSRIKHVEGTGEHEVGVSGDISADDIVAVHRGAVIQHEPAIKSSGFSQSASSRLHWEKIK